MWIPLLVSPLFALSPIAGCALAGRVRQTALPPTAAPLEAPRVTFAEPEPPGGPVPTGTTAPIPAAAPSRSWSADNVIQDGFSRRNPLEE